MTVLSVTDMSVTSTPTPPTQRSRSRMTAGQRTRATTRARLLASGKALFATQGLHQITTHDIAAHAGVAAGTFYNHFRDKAALFREITDEALAELTHRLDSVVDVKEDLEKGVRLQATALVNFAADNRDLIRILFSREADATAVQTDVLQLMADRSTTVRRELVANGTMPAEIDPEVFAQALIGMWARVVAWWAEDTTRMPREVVIETLTQIQLRGTHPQPKPSP